MNKYKQKLNNIKARRMNTNQRLESVLLFAAFVFIAFSIFFVGMSASQQIYSNYVNREFPQLHNTGIYFLIGIFILAIIYLSFRLTGLGLKSLTMAVSGIKED